METMEITNKYFFKGKTVLVTGHTGFKGTWLCKILIGYGAKVIGYSLQPPTQPSLYEIARIDNQLISIISDIRDFDKLLSVFQKYQPQIVFHLAAQPIVLDSYARPKYTYETNVLGTVNVLECIRQTASVKSFLNITTDKVYENDDNSSHPFTEEDKLDGFDPYSNSKSCSELVTHSYKKSFFSDGRCAISTARAGNVIGGGDFAEHRIIPDCVRAIEQHAPIIVRNPNSIRPYQHVLEPLYCYLLIAKRQYGNVSASDYYNVGPAESDCLSTGTLVELFCQEYGKEATWKVENINGPHEANFLKLNCSKVQKKVGWKPVWNSKIAVSKVVEWTKCYLNDKTQIPQLMDKQIKEYEKDSSL